MDTLVTRQPDALTRAISAIASFREEDHDELDALIGAVGPLAHAPIETLRAQAWALDRIAALRERLGR